MHGEVLKTQRDSVVVGVDVPQHGIVIQDNVLGQCRD